jgi:prolyl oligopeptidase
MTLVEFVDANRFDDPFRELEEDGSSVQRWQSKLDAEARELLRALPQHDAVRAAVERHLAACAVAVPIRACGRWYVCDGRAIRVSDAPGDPGRELITADRLVAGAQPHIDWFLPHPDRALVAAGVSHSGSEQTVLVFVDHDGHMLPSRVPYVWADAVGWLPGSRTLVVLTGGVPGLGAPRRELLEVTAGAGVHRLPLALRGGACRHALQISPDGRHVAVLEHPAAPRLLQVLDRTTGHWWEPPPLEPDATCHGLCLDGRYWAVTTDRASRGRLVCADIGSADDWDPVVAERSEVLRAVTVMGETLVLCYFQRGASRLRIVDRAGRDLGCVPLPDEGLCSTNGRAPGQYGGSPPVRADADGLTFAFGSVNRSPGLVRYDAATRRIRWIRKPRIALEGVRSEWRSCTSSDGSEVPYERAWRSGADVPRPTLIVAHGGWNAMTSSRGYLGPFAPFVERGGTIVFAHLRGDATFGADRWQAGRRHGKARSVADLLAIAEDVVARGVAEDGRVGVWGASNGGLLVGAALTRRPELFRVAVAVIPLCDMARFVCDPFGEHSAWEYGDPRIEADAGALGSYSPYHNVRPGARYPATLVVCGENDVRAPVWHGRKLVAAMRRASSSGEPILLRVHAGHGHISTGDEAPAWLVAEWLAFAIDRLGVG